MDIDELKDYYARVSQYNEPEELFGDLKGVGIAEQKRFLNDIRKELLKKYHPDLFVSKGDSYLYYAHQIAAMIGELFDKALDKIGKSIYGIGDPSTNNTILFTIETGIRKYFICENFLETDFSKTFRAEYVDESGERRWAFVKVCLDKKNNYLYRNEVNILKNLRHKSISHLLDHFVTTDGFEGIIFKFIKGYDLYEIRERFPDGVPDLHVFWILERLLSSIGHAHFNMIVHSNIEPGNIIIRPKDHNVVIVDFKMATENPGAHDFYLVATDGFSAPEVYNKAMPLPHGDIYAIGKCMIYLLGGDVSTNKMPRSVSVNLQRFILDMVEDNFRNRPCDAWQLHKKLSDLRFSLFGKRHLFMEFIVPDDIYKSDSKPSPAPDPTSANPRIINLIKTDAGLYEIPVTINNVLKLNFLLDSGASFVSIPVDVASTLLKTNTITKEDWIGSISVSLADGSVQNVQKIKLREINFGNDIVLTDVECLVSHSADAPLLLGQNVLKRFGSIRIDYSNDLFIFDQFN
jgi:serine/threonine protein kinase